MAPTGKRTTEKDFKKFQEYCIYWINYYGLLDWSCFFKWEDLETRDAETILDYTSRQVIFIFDKGVIDFDLRDLAFHEVTEALLLGKLRFMALERNATELAIKEEAHRVVMILCNVKNRKAAMK